MANLDTDMTKRLQRQVVILQKLILSEVGDIIEDSNTTTKEGYAPHESLSILR